MHGNQWALNISHIASLPYSFVIYCWLSMLRLSSKYIKRHMFLPNLAHYLMWAEVVGTNTSVFKHYSSTAGQSVETESFEPLIIYFANNNALLESSFISSQLHSVHLMSDTGFSPFNWFCKFSDASLLRWLPEVEWISVTYVLLNMNEFVFIPVSLLNNSRACPELLCSATCCHTCGRYK